MARALDVSPPPQHARYRELLDFVAPVRIPGLPSRPIFARQFARVFAPLMDAWTESQGKSIWLEKSPLHLRRIDLIERWVPGALFIHNVRSGPDNIASYYDAVRKYPEDFREADGVEFFIRQWLDDVSVTLAFAGRANHLVVGYRDVVGDTRATLQKVCRFMGVPFEEEMLENYKEAAPRVTRPSHQWMQGLTSPIASKDGTKFHTLFTEADQRRILDAVSRLDVSSLGLC